MSKPLVQQEANLAPLVVFATVGAWVRKLTCDYARCKALTFALASGRSVSLLLGPVGLTLVNAHDSNRRPHLYQVSLTEPSEASWIKLSPHGACSHVALLPSQNRAEFRRSLKAFVARHKPTPTSPPSRPLMNDAKESQNTNQCVVEPLVTRSVC